MDHFLLLIVLVLVLTTVNVEISAQYIFSRISRRALDARKFDVSENYNHNKTNRNNQYMVESHEMDPLGGSEGPRR